jgi:hypothetical protein
MHASTSSICTSELHASATSVGGEATVAVAAAGADPWAVAAFLSALLLGSGCGDFNRSTFTKHGCRNSK